MNDEELQQLNSLSKDLITAGSLKIGGLIVLDGQPCKIKYVAHSKVGKHGMRKVRIIDSI